MRENSRGGIASALAILLGGFLGFVQFALFFADLPGSPAVASRVAVAASLGALSGVALGRFRPGAWLPLSLLAVWGAIFWGIAFAAMRVEGWPAALAVPAALAALGGRAGAAWGRRRKENGGLSRY